MENRAAGIMEGHMHRMHRRRALLELTKGWKEAGLYTTKARVAWTEA